MADVNAKYCFKDTGYRKILHSPLKNLGFVPEKESELFVSGIPSSATVQDLARFFEQVGEVFQIRMMMEVDGARNRGFAFVTYMNATLTQKAMAELSNKPFFGVNGLSMQKSLNNCRIFVGGLPIEKTKDQIWQELMFKYNVTNIVDVITYRNYSNPAHNRGFVFLEFRNHEEASHFRAKFGERLWLFGKKLLVDWSVPVLETSEKVVAQVKIIFLRNLDVTLSSEDFARQMYKLFNRNVIEKIYKFKNYAYIHLNSRPNAEKLLDILNNVYKSTDVEVTWAKPPNKFTERTFRDKALLSRKAKPFVGTSPVHPPRFSSIVHHRPQLHPDYTSRIQNSTGTDFLSSRTPGNCFAPRGTSPLQPSRFASLLRHGPQLQPDYSSINHHFMGASSNKRSVGFIGPLTDLFQQNVFINTEYDASTSFNSANHNQPSPTGNLMYPMLTPNLTQFHQIQPYCQAQPYSNFTTSRTSAVGPSSRFSTCISRPTATPAIPEIRQQDMEDMVNNLLTDC